MSYLTYNYNRNVLLYENYIVLSEDAQEEKIKTDVNKVMGESNGKPIEWLKDKITKLRNLYSKFLNKANAEHSAGNIGHFKNILRIILNAVDKLVRKIVGISDKDKDSTVSYQEMEELKKMRSEYEDLIRKAQDEY